MERHKTKCMLHWIDAILTYMYWIYRRIIICIFSWYNALFHLNNAYFIPTYIGEDMQLSPTMGLMQKSNRISYKEEWHRGRKVLSIIEIYII